MAKRLLMWGVLAAVVVAVLIYALRPRPVPVDLHTVAAEPFEVTVQADGMSRVKDVFTVSAPVGGRLLRPGLEAGDPLVGGETVVATIEPSDPAFLDPRALAETRQDLEAAQAAQDRAAAELTRAEAELAFADAELERALELFDTGSVPRRFVEEAERAARAAEASVAAATADLDAREHEVMRLRARLFTPVARGAAASPCECVTLTSPIDGRVLQVFEKSETVVAPGTALLELGDPSNLEIVADFLSADAVRVRPGQRAYVEDWGGEPRLDARVHHVEPLGVTKVSALGIEEQRVNVVFELTSPQTQWAALGHNYRVTARAVLWSGEAVLTVPVTALFRLDGEWRVFVVESGRAVSRRVSIGQRAGLRTEVRDGLSVGEQVVVNPSDALGEGVAVAPRR